ncbi:unnamed protein product [Haemonchus placei]|uniref:Uncharacterized protein n=1 Tax=Haemonchus placei TaxID=6290 RepID=A0A0N4VZC5_HAEPC|nr:unnamed protein product [Haemonchus placei]
MSEHVGSLLDSYSFSWLAAGYAVAVTNQDERAAAASENLSSGSNYFLLPLSSSQNTNNSDFSTYDTSSFNLSTPYPSEFSSSFERSDRGNMNGWQLFLSQQVASKAALAKALRVRCSLFN